MKVNLVESISFKFNLDSQHQLLAPKECYLTLFMGNTITEYVLFIII